jgi:hypothetical protein
MVQTSTEKTSDVRPIRMENVDFACENQAIKFA